MNLHGHNSRIRDSDVSSKVGQLRINFGSIFLNFGAMHN
jgi:hypothetical protein